MEVVMRSDEGVTPPADTFVSLRIGQAQRHARFAPVRSYRFEAVDASRQVPCKLEVFKRIGHTTVTFGGSTGDIQDVDVPVGDGSSIRMRLSSSNARAATPGTTEKQKMKIVNSARSYLSQHRIEDLMKDALKEVMSVKPAKPHEFLAGYILEAGRTSLLPKIPADGLAKQSDMPIKAPPKLNNQLYSDALADKAANGIAQPRKLPPLDSKLKPSQSAPTLQTLPLLIQQQLPPWAQQQLVLAKPLEVPWQHRPSVASWCAQPSTRTKAAPVVQESLTVEVAEIRPWKLRPSVGTWCAPLPCPAPSPEFNQWQLRPSVGTWCAALLPSLECEPPFAPPSPAPEYRKWQLRPSVGTWCAAKPSPEPPEFRKWQLRPSVGTWCTAVQRETPTLEELTDWKPSVEESDAMNIILKGRQNEILDLSRKLRDVTASLEAAVAARSPDVCEWETKATALQQCISYAQNEYDALAQWGQRRGLSQPSSPALGALAI